MWWAYIRGGGYIRGGAYSQRFMVYSFTSIANQKSVRYSVSISYFTNIAVQNVNKVRACAQEWTSSLNVWLEFLSKGTFAPPPPPKGKGGAMPLLHPPPPLSSVPGNNHHRVMHLSMLSP